MSKPTLENLITYYNRLLPMIEWIGKERGCNLAHMKEHWKSGPNPFYNQLDTVNGDPLGLILVEYYGSPAKFATPLGGWSFNALNGSNRDSWQSSYVLKFGMKQVMSTEYNEDGQFGPAYSIHNDLEGCDFPSGKFTPLYIGIPGMKCHCEYTYDEAKEMWDKIVPHLNASFE